MEYGGWLRFFAPPKGWLTPNNGMFTTYQLVQDFAIIHSMIHGYIGYISMDYHCFFGHWMNLLHGYLFVNEIDLLIYLLIIHMIMDIVLKHWGM